MKRTGIIISLLAGAIFFAGAQPQTTISRLKAVAGAKKMNIVFILTDDHRYDFMGFTGKLPWLKTPNMDRMAGEGAYFENAFVTTALCSPSRASILTGMYAHVHTIVDNLAGEPSGLVYFPQYLQQAGYQTSFFGKWHMGIADPYPRPGFDHWESFKGQGIYYNPELNINGKKVAYGDSAYITDLLTEHAIDWLDKRDKGKPFFLYLSHKAVHSPLAPAKRHKGLYKNREYRLPSTYYQTLNDDYKTLRWPEWVKQQRYSWHGVDYPYHSHQDIGEIVRTYCETLMAVDESVGTIMDYLKKNGLNQNTMVVYMGDNGFSWGEHGLIDKRHFYEESVKVPFLVYAPGLLKGGKIVKQMIQNIDIAPTILELAGLKKPDYMPGRSFIQLLKGDTMGWRKKIFYEYYWEYDYPMTPTVFGVRTDRYKLIRYMGVWDQNELYDLQEDPDEKMNLMGKPEYEELAGQLTGDLFDWLETTKGMQVPLKRTVKHPFGDWKHPAQY
ncbi:sulfatase family protein [Niabella aurantiaca]|uniref:sulfatase family protein n=1 Tax=Niabella aurantiaca TaxID=379900 RepID=UPI0003787FA0|nr:sulfatase [Niabella aurantiaca]